MSTPRRPGTGAATGADACVAAGGGAVAAAAAGSPETGGVDVAGAGGALGGGTGAGAGAAAGAAAGVGAAATVGAGFTMLVVPHAAAHNALARTHAIDAIAATGERGACDDRIGRPGRVTEVPAADRADVPRPGVERGALYVVATPLGNLRDLTTRARDVLGAVDRIYAEDTRVTATLLAHIGVATRPVALHAHNEAARTAQVLAALDDGRSVALVSDAGTPAISDPGARVVRAARDAGHKVIPVPGPSALAAAVSAAGLDAERFVFVGFVPPQAKARRELLDVLGALPVALVFFEAPHRVRETVAMLAQALGAARKLVVAREITKRFEEIARIDLGRAEEWFAADPNRERGEFVLIVDLPPPRADAAPGLQQELDAWLRALLREVPPSTAARIAAAASGQPRDALYARAVALKSAD
jgi:16S rRNA (cytidine1402-2'-O)-methyltransferase